jgi:hypothetical protein
LGGVAGGAAGKDVRSVSHHFIFKNIKNKALLISNSTL